MAWSMRTAAFLSSGRGGEGMWQYAFLPARYRAFRDHVLTSMSNWHSAAPCGEKSLGRNTLVQKCIWANWFLCWAASGQNRALLMHQSGSRLDLFDGSLELCCGIWLGWNGSYSELSKRTCMNESRSFSWYLMLFKDVGTFCSFLKHS